MKTETTRVEDPVVLAAQAAFSVRIKDSKDVSENTKNAQAIAKVWRGAGTINYFAWVSAANSITIRACNIDPSVKQTAPGAGAIRVDVWKH
jgi:hypothetical protein